MLRQLVRGEKDWPHELPFGEKKIFRFFSARVGFHFVLWFIVNYCELFGRTATWETRNINHSPVDSNSIRKDQTRLMAFDCKRKLWTFLFAQTQIRLNNARLIRFVLLWMILVVVEDSGMKLLLTVFECATADDYWRSISGFVLKTQICLESGSKVWFLFILFQFYSDLEKMFKFCSDLN